MRYFPSAARQRASAAIAVGAVSLALLTSPWTDSPAHADDKGKLQHQRDGVKSQIHDASADLEDTSRDYAATSRRLSRAKDKLVSARSALSDVGDRLASAKTRSEELEADLTTSRAKLADAAAELREGRSDTAAQKDEVRVAILTDSDPGDLQLRSFGSLLGASSIDDLNHDLAAQDVLIGRNDAVYRGLQVVEGRLSDRKDDVADATADLAEKEQDAADHLEVVNGLYKEARGARDAVRSLVEDGRTAKAAADRARVRDRAMLASLRKRENAIAGRLRDLARQPAARRSGYNGSSDGFLEYPANGPVTSPFGYRVHPIYGYYSLHNGTDFGVPCGTALHASAAGTVVDEYYDSVYGNRLYLSVGNVNGKNLTLVYNHMSGYVAKEGQQVARGETIGYSGTTGWSTGCHLHFTVLANGTPVNPMGYF